MVSRMVDKVNSWKKWRNGPIAEQIQLLNFRLQLARNTFAIRVCVCVLRRVCLWRLLVWTLMLKRETALVLQIVFGLESYTEGILLIHHKSIFYSLNAFTTLVGFKKPINELARLSTYLRKACSTKEMHEVE